MPFSQGARTSLRFIRESVFGETPATPTLVQIPYKTQSLALTKERLEGADILGDRLPFVDRHGFRTAGGSIEVDLRKGDYDAFLESAFFNEFNNNVLKVGTTPRFLTIEDAALDISQFRVFRGMAVNIASFSIAPNQMIQTTFELIGRDMEQRATTVGTSGPTAPTGNEPFDSYNAPILEGGPDSGDQICIVSALNFSINNGLSPAFVIGCGNGRSPQMEFGNATIEGTMTVYYENDDLIKKFLDEEETELTITVDDPTQANGYSFFFPRIKYNGAAVPVANPQSRFIELPFVALKDADTATSLQLTRAVPVSPP